MKYFIKFKNNFIAEFLQMLSLIVKLLSVISSTLFIAVSTYAQGLLPPPPIPMTDAAGVELSTGYPSITQNDISIGNGFSSLSHTIATHENMFWGFVDDYTLQALIIVVPGQAYRLIGTGHSSQQFKLISGDIIQSGIYESVNSDGGKLVQLSSSTFQYTSRNGTIYLIGAPVETITYPNGLVVSIYKKGDRIQSVITNTGIQLKYNYRSNTYPNPHTNDGYSQWKHPSSIVAINNAVEYCDPTADSCSLTNTWPTVNYEWPTWLQLYPAEGTGTATGFFKVKDPMNRITTYTHSSYTKKIQGGYPYEPRITSIIGPQRSQSFNYQNLSVCEMASYITLETTCKIVNRNVVITSTASGVNCTYSYALPQTNYVGLQISSACGNTFSSLMKDHYGTVGGPMTYHGNDVIASFMQNDRRLLTSTTQHGKNLSFEYDSRGNLTKRTQTAMAGSPEAGSSIISDAGFDVCTAANYKWCNKPRWVSTPKGYVGGYQTDYTYYDDNGEIKSVELPADKNGFRAKTQYSYTQRYAWYKNVSGSFTQSLTPIWLLTEERTCTEGHTNGNTCTDPTKLVTTSYEYGADSGPNNLWLRGVVKTAGSESRRTCYQYDKYGNQIAVTTPNANLSSCQ